MKYSKTFLLATALLSIQIENCSISVGWFCFSFLLFYFIVVTHKAKKDTHTHTLILAYNQQQHDTQLRKYTAGKMIEGGGHASKLQASYTTFWSLKTVFFFFENKNQIDAFLFPLLNEWIPPNYNFDRITVFFSSFSINEDASRETNFLKRGRRCVSTMPLKRTTSSFLFLFQNTSDNNTNLRCHISY